jgi:hypothetical protein
MHRLRSLLRLSRRDVALLVQAISLLVSVRLGLWVVPFATLRQMLSTLARKRRAPVAGDPATLNRVIWAVETAGRQFPAVGTCLIQALAAHVLLGRRGCVPDLRIGVKRNEAGKFVAHAWLEKDGAILIGGEPHQSYIPMPGLNGLERHASAESRSDLRRHQCSTPVTQRGTELLATRLD